VGLTDSQDRAKAVIEAMEMIEADHENLRGVLPKGEYRSWTPLFSASSCARSTLRN